MNKMDEVKSKSSNPSDYGYTYLTPREQPPAEVGWKDREAEAANGIISLYSQNVVKEGETTESVDRESIANLSTTKQQWETIFTSNLQQPVEEETISAKKKAAPKWEVKLPASYRGGDRSNASLKLDSSISANGDLKTVEVENKSPVLDEPSYNNNNNMSKDMYDSNHNTSGSVNGHSEQRYESAIEYEIRMAREREEMLRLEKEQRLASLSPSSSSPAPTQPMPVLSSIEAVNGESESYQSAYNELAEADRAPDVWSMDGGVIRNEGTLENKDVDPNESIIEREIRLQREKEAELERQRVMLAQTLPASAQPQQQEQGERPKAHPPVNKSPVYSNNPAQNEPPPSQESRIARELRELQEREEEMKRMRESMQGMTLQKSESSSINAAPAQPSQPAPKSMSLNIQTNNNSQKISLNSPSQTTPNSQGTWQREVSPFVSQQRRVSQDSGSNHSLSKTSSDTAATTPSRNISVQPIPDEGSDEDDKPDYFKKQETPIEREMRIAKERENELRRMKGMPELSNKDDYYGSYGAGKESGNNVQSKPLGYQAPSQQSLKKLSSSRLQQEISAQKQREKNEGKIISDSEQINPHKYMEVTGSQAKDGSEKRNFVTKRAPPQVAEVPKTAETSHENRGNPPPPAQSAPKKGLGGGSKNFSYKEFKQTAESKIERELREMREREEELRNQRSGVPQTPR